MERISGSSYSGHFPSLVVDSLNILDRDLVRDVGRFTRGNQSEPQDEGTRRDYHRVTGYLWLIYTAGGRSNPPMSPNDSAPEEQVKSEAATKSAPVTAGYALYRGGPENYRENDRQDASRRPRR